MKEVERRWKAPPKIGPKTAEIDVSKLLKKVKRKKKVKILMPDISFKSSYLYLTLGCSKLFKQPKSMCVHLSQWSVLQILVQNRIIRRLNHELKIKYRLSTITKVLQLKRKMVRLYLLRLFGSISKWIDNRVW